MESHTHSESASRPNTPPRAETPEPGSKQGRRNTQGDIQLLEEDGQLSQKAPTFSHLCPYTYL